MVLSRGVMSALLLVMLSAAGLAQGGAGLPQGLSPEASAALLKAYPDFLDRIEGNDLVWKDGTRMRIDGGKGAMGTRPFEAILDDPDIKDMFAFEYPVGEKGRAPDVNVDPGRARLACGVGVHGVGPGRLDVTGFERGREIGGQSFVGGGRDRGDGDQAGGDHGGGHQENDRRSGASGHRCSKLWRVNWGPTDGDRRRPESETRG